MSEAGRRDREGSANCSARFKMESGQKGVTSVASRWKSEASSWRGTPPSPETPASASLTGWSTRACRVVARQFIENRGRQLETTGWRAAVREQGLLADRRDR